MINSRFTFCSVGLLYSINAYALHDQRLDHFLSLSLEELMDLEVTISTDTKQTVARAPAAVTVITAEDIKATGATDLVDILESVPGIHVRANQFAFRPLVQFRGTSANQTLLMINGAPMRDLMWGFGIFWKGIPSSIIDRVEIIRGPGSALFGADASAGVINVITKTAGKIDHNEIGLRGGSFNTNTGWLQYGDSWNGFDVGLSINLSTTDGHDPLVETDAQTRQDLALGSDVSLAPDNAQFGWKNHDIRFSVARDGWRLLMDYTKHSDLEVGLTGAGVLDPVTTAEDSRFNLNLLYNNPDFNDAWGIDAELRYQDLDYSSGDGFQERPPGAFNGDYPLGVINQMRSAERRLNFEASGLYSGLDKHNLRLGLGYTWQDLYYVKQLINMGIGPSGELLPPGSPLVDVSDTPYAFAPEKIRTIRYLFVQDVWSLRDNWQLTAGVRYDDYSDFGDTFNPRLALVWQVTDKFTTKMLYGKAFRPPSFQELFAETSFSEPNPDLEPERSETTELILSYMPSKDLAIGFNLYLLKQSDFIRAISSPGEASRRFHNTGEHTIRGFEIETKWQATDDLRFSANYTKRNPDENQFRSVDQPKQDAYLRADWAFLHDWNWNIQANWIGERDRRSDDLRQSLDDYTITDTTIRYTGQNAWELALSVRNLFDEDAREYTSPSIANDLRLSERSFYAEIQYNFPHALMQ
ncbi:TonB-dependent receptor plug domain-containing protein [Candidatus Thiodiazotropha sp. CDECU1]|uniref:TonB-dependent receptor plug domain-containing protein n=1 Tax=Candidatus Thiodiazotropha sp. CDECU1 TaxID=3065865 RepID=UPI00292EED66|nr:TonB-dependent receptor [Candidatus Thiodiazotropha sp. CDECU1]